MDAPCTAGTGLSEPWRADRVYGPGMRLRRFAMFCVVAAFPLLAACGGSSPAAQPTIAEVPSATGAPAIGGQETPGGTADAIADLDVCGLLSSEDAAAVAQERGLSGSAAADTTYSLTSTKVDYSPTSPVPTAGCSFTIEGGGASGTVVIEVVSADNFALYSDGEAVPGLGDEAFSGGGTTVVRVGDLMLQTSENSFTESFAVALYQKMIPNMP